MVFYGVFRWLVSVCFNILNLMLGGNLPPLGSASVMVEEQNRYLVVESPDGSIVFPGGFTRWREHPMQTALREAREETGLHLRLGDMVGYYSTISRSFAQMSTLTIIYHAEVVGGELRGSIEGRPHWRSEAELRNEPKFRHEEMLEGYLRYRARHAESGGSGSTTVEAAKLNSD